MKQLLLLISTFLFISNESALKAQSVGVRYDTVYVTAGTIHHIPNDINNLSSGNIRLNWKIVNSTFPAGWVPGSGICDNAVCYTGPSLWPSGATETSTDYAPGWGSYQVILDLSSISGGLGTYLTVRLYNAAVPTDSASQTYIIGTASSLNIPTLRSPDDVMLYPNPANGELNVVYDAGADVHSIGVYNIIGKLMTVYKVTNNSSANLNIESIPSGIYFVRLFNSRGDAIVTRKFTKQ